MRFHEWAKLIVNALGDPAARKVATHQYTLQVSMGGEPESPVGTDGSTTSHIVTFWTEWEFKGKGLDERCLALVTDVSYSMHPPRNDERWEITLGKDLLTVVREIDEYDPFGETVS